GRGGPCGPCPLPPRTLARVFLALSALTFGAAVPPARAALPPQYGGTLTLPAPEPITRIDPLSVRTHLEATLVEAVFDGLYEARPSGVIEPVLAEGPPVLEGSTALIRLRPGVLRHGNRPLTARDG